MRKLFIIAIFIILYFGGLYSQDSNILKHDKTTGYLLLDGIISTFEKYQSLISESDKKSIMESLDYHLLKAKKARESGEIDTTFFERYHRILKVIQLSILKHTQKGLPKIESFLSSLISEEIGKFDIPANLQTRSAQANMRTIARALAQEVLSLKSYLDNRSANEDHKQIGLRTSEKFLLLALQEESGKFQSTADYINFGLAGTILFELIERKLIRAKDKKIYLDSFQAEDDFMLDWLMNAIKKSKKPHSIKYWVKKIEKRVKTFKRYLLFKLIERKILTIQYDTIFLFFNKNRYPILNSDPRNKIKEELKNVILEKQPLTSEKSFLISLLPVCRLLTTVFEPDHRFKSVKKVVKQISKENSIARAVRKAIKDKHDEQMAHIWY